jgi:hypothetical protein
MQAFDGRQFIDVRTHDLARDPIGGADDAHGVVPEHAARFRRACGLHQAGIKAVEIEGDVDRLADKV